MMWSVARLPETVKAQLPLSLDAVAALPHVQTVVCLSYSRHSSELSCTVSLTDALPALSRTRVC